MEKLGVILLLVGPSAAHAQTAPTLPPPDMRDVRSATPFSNGTTVFRDARGRTVYTATPFSNGVVLYNSPQPWRR